MTAEEYYLQGNEYRRAGNWQQALNCYMEAIALDPDSPAVQAREMINENLKEQDYGKNQRCHRGEH